ncbi:ShlB/FhaC/HecB family hemolysin secretion/activation protein [Pantoea sp. 1.19]|uniref:ShlB/FhaC/HecB family hemolysin secretion/activation protein n=1 Tax=Pantoea sp. 1.19 TaxID=1925589 RepID=UPI0009488BBB|nr:ShlB/FhaC/HecB family hemolysin secretion/activation protein [Pantoea sp. 1.19]
MKMPRLTTPGLAALLALCCLHFSPLTPAAPTPAPPSLSGQLLQTNPMLHNRLSPVRGEEEKLPAPAEPPLAESRSDLPALWVRTIRVLHVPEAAKSAVSACVAPFAGRRMSLSALQHLAVTLTAVLQQQGERLSYAYLPDQRVVDNTVVFDIIHGHIERARVARNASLLSDRTLRGYLGAGDADGRAIGDWEAMMTRLADLPGVGEVSSYLTPGDRPGGSVLNLKLAAAPRVEGALVMDNLGSLASGRNRLGGQLTINSPAGWGDRLQALAWLAPDFLQIDHRSDRGNTLIGRLAWDLPVTANGSRLGMAASRVSYRLGGPVLHGLGDGFADILSLYASSPLRSGERARLTLGGNLDIKRMMDRFWGMENRRRAPVAGLQLAGDFQGALLGRPWRIQLQLAPAIGRLSNRDEWNGAATRGRFLKLMETLNLLQALTPGINLALSVSGQQASKNLDGAEKLSLGGAYAVRAYGNSAASADSGIIVSPSISAPIPLLANARVELFYDYGRGKLQKFAPQKQTVIMKGYGIGVSWQFHPRAFINASYAWRQGSDPRLGPQNKASGWVTAGLQF